MDILTKRGYSLYDVTSTLQKAIRRNEPIIAGYFALELFASNFWLYLWKRLVTISAEDVYEPITNEIYSLFQAFCLINEGKKNVEKGRIFISKAVILLCRSKKSRDGDHIGILTYDRKIKITDEQIEKLIKDVDKNEYIDIPEFAYDVHTKLGKLRGMTKDEFIRTEFEELKPRQAGLFDEEIMTGAIK